MEPRQSGPPPLPPEINGVKPLPLSARTLALGYEWYGAVHRGHAKWRIVRLETGPHAAGPIEHRFTWHVPDDLPPMTAGHAADWYLYPLLGRVHAEAWTASALAPLWE